MTNIFKQLAESDISWLSNRNIIEKSVISTRIRLARNIKNVPFPSVASKEDLTESMEKVFDACKKSKFFIKARIIYLNDISDIDRRLLLERHIISYEHAMSSLRGGIVLDDREQLSVMVNEEDHIRIQYFSGGLNLFESWDVINSVDNDLSNYLDYSFSEKWGYLTACPTNTGTGMRASCQMHLPALDVCRGLKNTMEHINKLGMVVRGIYGEGTKIMGNILQISNQVTLGVSEEKIIDNLYRLVVQVDEREKKTRMNIINNSEDFIRDNVNRSFGVLANAHKISFEEAISLLSNVKLGIYFGILNLDINKINNLIIKMQPAHIQQAKGKELSVLERSIIRAEMIKHVMCS